MQDACGRTIQYLRLSVTDRCCYRCAYCMAPDAEPKRAPLPLDELFELAAAAVRCGVKKIRLTGGEPLLREGIAELCARLRRLDGLEELALTTNGARLPALAAPLRAAGVDRLNISLDSLRPERFRAITRRGELADALAGIEAAKAAGFRGLKINTVLLGGVNDDEIPALAELTREEDVQVRFIELMPAGVCRDFPPERFLSAGAVLDALPDLEPLGGDGVAELYRLPGCRGAVGLIRPMSRRFCAACGRVRITADGHLKPCLHSELELPLRGLRGAALDAAIREAVLRKPARHRLNAGGSASEMYEIGG